MKPFSQACVNNAEPIVSQLIDYFSHCQSVLEIGSGTGQHACYFSKHLSHLNWQTSDLLENHQGIIEWVQGLSNVQPPLVLDVNAQIWPDTRYDGFFTANTLHIMSWDEVVKLFQKLSMIANDQAALVVYGPFNRGGQYTSDSNAEFDRWLKSQVPHRGIRDIEAVMDLAQEHGFQFVDEQAMPANNLLLKFLKI